MKAKILIAEDNELVQQLYEHMFDDHNTLIVGNGELAMDAVYAQMSAGIPYDLIITDYNMPKYNGGQVVDYLRKVESRFNRPKTPVIMVCSDIVLPGNLDHTYFVEKPFDVSHLETLANACLQDKKQSRGEYTK